MMMYRVLTFATILAAVISGQQLVAAGEQVDVERLVQTIRDVGPKGEGHREAVVAVGELSKVDSKQIPQILAGMNGAGPLATNWLRGVVESIAQHELNDGRKLPAAELEKFLNNQNNAPRARRLAFELIVRNDPQAEQRLVPSFLNDPSLELRRDAVAMKLDSAASLTEKDKAAAVATYREALTAARDIDQIKSATEQLRSLGETVDLPLHFGFIMRWNLIGPFDNTDKSGFDVAYPPEEEIRLNAEYKGKVGNVRWFKHATEDEYGMVDLNKAIGKHMGVVGYAYTEFVSDVERDAELRLGCINANKVWFNGKLLTANEVYHARTDLDQYVTQSHLKKGRNQILLKICQNEQTEDWAQNWQFQLRVCDEFGTAILSLDRLSTEAAENESSQ